jgi:cell division protein FtsQ
MRRNGHQALIVGRHPKYLPKRAQRTRLTKRTPPSERGTMRQSVLGWCAFAGIIIFLTAAFIQGQHLAWQNAAHNYWANWTASQGFVLQQVQITGRKNLAQIAVWQALEAKLGTPLFALNLQKIHDNLIAQPWVEQAWVSRVWPNTLHIVLQERVPVAQWQVQGQKKLVDAKSIILAHNIAPAFQKLPTVVGSNAPQQVQALLQLLQGEPNIARQMIAATWVGNRRWNLHFKNNLVVKLPEENPQLAFAELSRFDAEQQLLARDLMVIDLRLAGKMVLQPTPRANLLIQRPNFDPDAKVNQPQAAGNQI